ELGVRAVLVGKLAQRGDSLSINVELVDARDDNHIWGDQYTRKLADIAGLQEAISKDIAEKVRPKLSGEQKTRLATPHTQNAEAYELYLKGRFYWSKRTKEGMDRGIRYFQQHCKKTQITLSPTRASQILTTCWAGTHLFPRKKPC